MRPPELTRRRFQLALIAAMAGGSSARAVSRGEAGSMQQPPVVPTDAQLAEELTVLLGRAQLAVPHERWRKVLSDYAEFRQLPQALRPGAAPGSRPRDR